MPLCVMEINMTTASTRGYIDTCLNICCLKLWKWHDSCDLGTIWEEAVVVYSLHELRKISK
jgi:hypothetical protein